MASQAGLTPYTAPKHHKKGKTTINIKASVKLH
jgi:hypothetical protein